MGFITALPEVVSVPGFGATIVYLVVRAVKSMKRGAQLDFQLQNFAAWLGLFVGGTAIGAWDDLDIFTAAFMFWIVSSIVGGLLVKFGPREEAPEEEVPRLGPGNR